MAEPGPGDAPPQPPHVVLVGMMGVGKSTVGKRVARLLERPFVDADTELVRRSGRSVADWFAACGEPAFREAESDVLTSLLDADEPTVVAAGGGVVIAPANRERLRRADVFVVWLRADPGFLTRRVARKEHRPLIADDPAGTLTRLVALRDPWYAEVAQSVIDVTAVQDHAERPKWVLAERVADAVRAHDAAGMAGR